MKNADANFSKNVISEVYDKFPGFIIFFKGWWHQMAFILHTTLYLLLIGVRI